MASWMSILLSCLQVMNVSCCYLIDVPIPSVLNSHWWNWNHCLKQLLQAIHACSSYDKMRLEMNMYPKSRPAQGVLHVIIDRWTDTDIVWLASFCDFGLSGTDLQNQSIFLGMHVRVLLVVKLAREPLFVMLALLFSSCNCYIQLLSPVSLLLPEELHTFLTDRLVYDWFLLCVPQWNGKSGWLI